MGDTHYPRVLGISKVRPPSTSPSRPEGLQVNPNAAGLFADCEKLLDAGAIIIGKNKFDGRVVIPILRT